MLRDEEEKNAKVLLSEGEAEAASLINNAVKAFGSGIRSYLTLSLNRN